MRMHQQISITCQNELVKGSILSNFNRHILLSSQSRADKCSVCGEIIVGAYYNIGDKILCENDYKANCEICPRYCIFEYVYFHIFVQLIIK